MWSAILGNSFSFQHRNYNFNQRRKNSSKYVDRNLMTPLQDRKMKRRVSGDSVRTCEVQSLRPVEGQEACYPWTRSWQNSTLSYLAYCCMLLLADCNKFKIKKIFQFGYMTIFFLSRKNLYLCVLDWNLRECIRCYRARRYILICITYIYIYIYGNNIGNDTVWV